MFVKEDAIVGCVEELFAVEGSTGTEGSIWFDKDIDSRVIVMHKR